MNFKLSLARNNILTIFVCQNVDKELETIVSSCDARNVIKIDLHILTVFFILFQLLSGNTNTYTVVEQKFDPPVIATKIRFLPYSDHVRTVCMRIEILGCKFVGKFYVKNISGFKCNFIKI